MKRVDRGAWITEERGNRQVWKEGENITVAKKKADHPSEIPRHKEKAGWAYAWRVGSRRKWMILPDELLRPFPRKG